MKLTIATFLFTIIYLLFTAPMAHSQELSVGINPPLIQIEASAPAIVKTPISIENYSDQNITYGIFLRPFEAGSEKNGEPNYDQKLLEENKDFLSKVQVIDGERSITEITLSPKQKKELIVRIGIPKGEKPEDHYFSVVFISQPEDTVNNKSFVGARAGIATNVLLNIGPKDEPYGRIQEFGAPKFVTKGPLGFTLEIANDNNYFVTPTGNLIIKNIFGQVVGNIEFGPVNILASSNRYITNSDENGSEPKLIWNEKFLLGIYKAEVNVALTDKGPLLKDSITFFAFPLELVLGIIVVIVLVTGLIRRARSKTEDES